MGRPSSTAALTADTRNRLKDHLDYILAHKDDVPGLVRRTADLCGCTVNNVYSVLHRRTFNADVVRIMYEQVVVAVGDIPRAAVRTNDERELVGEGKYNLLMKTQVDFRSAIAGAEQAARTLAVSRARYAQALEEARLFLRFNVELVSDQLGTTLSTAVEDAPPHYMEARPASPPDPVEADPYIIAVRSSLIESGELGLDGRPVPVELRPETPPTEPVTLPPPPPGLKYTEDGALYKDEGPDDEEPSVEVVESRGASRPIAEEFMPLDEAEEAVEEAKRRMLA